MANETSPPDKPGNTSGDKPAQDISKAGAPAPGKPKQDAIEKAYEASTKASAKDSAAAAKPETKSAQGPKKSPPKSSAPPASASKDDLKNDEPPKAESKRQPDDGQPKVSEAPKPEQPPQEKSSGGGRFAWLVVLLLLFFIGGVAATPYFLPQIAPVLPDSAKAWFAVSDRPPPSVDLSGITARLDKLDSSVEGLRKVAADAQAAAQAAPQDTGDAAAVDEAALTALAARIDGLAGALEQVTQAQTEQAGSYARLQESLEAVPTEGGGGVSPAIVAALRSQMTDLANAQNALAGQVTSVGEGLQALTSTVNQNQQNAVNPQALTQVLNTLRTRLGGLEEQVSAASNAASQAADPAALAGMQQQVGAKIADFETRLGALENVRQQATAAMVAGLEAARLAQAIAYGRAYSAELEALRKLKSQAGPALPDIADLLDEIAPFADSGIPSGARLAAQLEDRSREILTAAATPEDAGWWERLMARLRNLVTVRKVGAGTEGAGPTDVLARAEEAARAGEWSAVVAEIETMPAPAQSSLGQWWEHARARATAQQVLADLSARLGVAAADDLGGAR